LLPLVVLVVLALQELAVAVLALEGLPPASLLWVLELHI
jgi:hypothetical protein